MDTKTKINSEGGYALIAILLLLSLGLLVGAGMIDSASSNTKTRALVKTRSEYYYEVEETLNKTVSWLQENSKSLVDGFTAANFSSNFDLGSPALGDNEGQDFGAYSMVKMSGTNNSVLLTNNDFFGTSAFPAVNNIDTGTAFDAITSFQNADLGEANARVLVIWARETDGNYEPIFRVDVVTGNNPDRGVHSFSYVYSSLVTAGGTPFGFYGRDWLRTKGGNNTCWSYAFVHNGTSWEKGAQRSNCVVQSDSTLTLKSHIHGDAESLAANPSVVLQRPTGAVSGNTCEGAGCHGNSLPALSMQWSDHCGSGSDVNVSGIQTLPGGCYRDITIGNGDTLILNDTSTDYKFRSFDFGNNATIRFQPGTNANDKITMYVEEIAANNNRSQLNASQVINIDNKPSQLLIYYYGPKDLKINGNSDTYAFIVAPNADVELLGNGDYYGGLKAKTFYVNGNGSFNYDETGGAGNPAVSDMNYTLKKASQRYR
ncbi:hypothetical protein MRY87_09860 [bacterium]|nr:hypothetical protein [bacterium]